MQIAALDALGEVDLLGRGEQGVAARVGQQLVDRLGDERVGGADLDALDRVVQPLGRSDRLAVGVRLGVLIVLGAGVIERYGVCLRGSLTLASFLIRCLESELYASIVALSIICFGAASRCSFDAETVPHLPGAAALRMPVPLRAETPESDEKSDTRRLSSLSAGVGGRR